jgi:hypothetical protein
MHIVAVLVTLMVSHHNFTTKQNYWKYSLLNMARRKNGSWFLFVCVWNQQNTWICGGGSISMQAHNFRKFQNKNY